MRNFLRSYIFLCPALFKSILLSEYFKISFLKDLQVSRKAFYFDS